jgi:hypothetical protein
MKNLVLPVLLFAVASAGCATKSKEEVVQFTAFASTSGFEADVTYKARAIEKDSVLRLSIETVHGEVLFQCDGKLPGPEPVERAQSSELTALLPCEHQGELYQLRITTRASFNEVVANIALLDEHGRPLGGFDPVTLRQN